MISPTGRSEAFLDRLDVVSERLRRHGERDAEAAGLTEPDPSTGERWEWGQVWAHLAEFPPYWMAEIRRILATADLGPVGFGRVKSDPARIAAIEADRREPIDMLWTRVRRHLAELRTLLEEMPDAGWGRRGVHSTLGVMEMPRIVDEFLVGHLEEHAAQLDGLSAKAAGTPERDG